MQLILFTCSIYQLLTLSLWGFKVKCKPGVSLVQVKEVLAVRNGAQGLLQLLGSEPQELVVEVAWVICHMMHGQETDLNRLVHLGMVTVVLQLCHKCVQQVSTHHSALLLLCGVTVCIVKRANCVTEICVDHEPCEITSS